MNHHTHTTMAAMVAAVAACASVHAGVAGLYVETVQNTTQASATYKLFIQFDADQPTDRLVNVFDTDIVFGESLFQHSLGTDLGPHATGLDPFFEQLQFDSWVGVNAGTPAVDPDWDAAYFASGQGIIGGWNLSVFDPNNSQDADGRVLVMFLTLLGDDLPTINGLVTTAGESKSGHLLYTTSAFAGLIEGHFAIAYNPFGASAGGIEAVEFDLVPAPGAMGLLSIAAMCGGRRRRGC